jgi:ubiquinone/menaquinone biosynthesis C-methylase UbiE
LDYSVLSAKLIDMATAEAYRKIINVKESYEQIATGYNRVRAQPWKECVNFIKNLNACSLLLDLGCGNGRHTVASVSQGYETVGVDFSKNMLRIAKNKLKSTNASVDMYHFVLADVSHLPFKDDSFDAILYIATLHNLPTRSFRVKSLYEIGRVLKSKGRCLISVWKRFQFRFLFTLIKTYLKKIAGMSGDFEVSLPWKINSLLVNRYYYLYDAKQLRKDIEEAKLNILNFLKVKIGARVVSDNYIVIVTKQIYVEGEPCDISET